MASVRPSRARAWWHVAAVALARPVLSLLLLLLVALQRAPVAAATSGVDVSENYDIPAWQCLARSGVRCGEALGRVTLLRGPAAQPDARRRRRRRRSFAVIRGWCSFGGPDVDSPHTVYNVRPACAGAARSAGAIPTRRRRAQAWDGGMKHVDIYLFPCAGMDALVQVHGLVQFMANYNATYGTVWFDIETNPSAGCGWSGDVQRNCAYVATLVRAAQDLHRPCGVYASRYMWDSIMGASCTAAAAVPLWYADWDGDVCARIGGRGRRCVRLTAPVQPSFSGFVPFGGWQRPAMKQYASGGVACGVNADRNWYP